MLTRTYKSQEVLCKACRTKSFKTAGNKKKYGIIVVHKKGCKFMEKWTGK
jgi:hypothetical protein